MNQTAKGKHAREAPAPALPFSLLTQDDHRQRLVMAFAAALALEMVLAQLVPWRTSTIPPEAPEIITIARIMRIQHKPTPKPIVHAHVIAPTNLQPKVINPGKPSENQHIRRIASARPMVHTKYHKAPALVHVPIGGQGAGSSKTAKAATGGVGPGGTGTGESGTGVGTGGAPAAHEPCGYVEFTQTDQPTTDSSTGRIWEHISMTVRFPDGTAQSADLDYPWYYASSSVDPFRLNTKTALFQFPPAGQSVPPLVQYVIDHTTPAGNTRLKPCPTG
jgi:hypothetical protein